MKTKTTLELEKALEHYLIHNNQFYCFECEIGYNGKRGNEIVDAMSLNYGNCITCFEIKQNLTDFHSGMKWSFYGDKNYFVMPYALFDKVWAEIPKNVGVLCPCTKIPMCEETETGTAYYTKIEYWKEGEMPLELNCVKPAKEFVSLDKTFLLAIMVKCYDRDFVRGYKRCGAEVEE